MTGNNAMFGRHRCVPGKCPVSVPNSQLFCRTHWYMLPVAMRDAVYGSWDHGRGAGSPSHMSAVVAALDYVTKKLDSPEDDGGHGLVSEGQHPLFGDPE